MALTVKDILQLDGLSKMRLIAGEGGLDRYVVSLGIADNEFSSFADQSERNVFEADMIILSTLLFPKKNLASSSQRQNFSVKSALPPLPVRRQSLRSFPRRLSTLPMRTTSRSFNTTLTFTWRASSLKYWMRFEKRTTISFRKKTWIR